MPSALGDHSPAGGASRATPHGTQLSVSVFVVDHELAVPSETLGDPVQSGFAGLLDAADAAQLPPAEQALLTRQLVNVPVLRVFGRTRDGARCVARVHGQMPYLYIPWPEDYPPPAHRVAAARKLLQLTLALEEHPLAKGFKDRGPNGTTTAPPTVYSAHLVQGFDFYGYHPAPRCFVKLVVVNPYKLATVAAVLGSTIHVLGRQHQPYDAHFAYVMQAMLDLGLTGMGSLHVCDMKKETEGAVPGVPGALGRVVDVHVTGVLNSQPYRDGRRRLDQRALREEKRFIAATLNDVWEDLAWYQQGIDRDKDRSTQRQKQQHPAANTAAASSSGGGEPFPTGTPTTRDTSRSASAPPHPHPTPTGGAAGSQPRPDLPPEGVIAQMFRKALSQAGRAHPTQGEAPAADALPWATAPVHFLVGQQRARAQRADLSAPLRRVSPHRGGGASVRPARDAGSGSPVRPQQLSFRSGAPDSTSPARAGVSGQGGSQKGDETGSGAAASDLQLTLAALRRLRGGAELSQEDDGNGAGVGAEVLERAGTHAGWNEKEAEDESLDDSGATSDEGSSDGSGASAGSAGAMFMSAGTVSGELDGGAAGLRRNPRDTVEGRSVQVPVPSVSRRVDPSIGVVYASSAPLAAHVDGGGRKRKRSSGSSERHAKRRRAVYDASALPAVEIPMTPPDALPERKGDGAAVVPVREVPATPPEALRREHAGETAAEGQQRDGDESGLEGRDGMHSSASSSSVQVHAPRRRSARGAPQPPPSPSHSSSSSSSSCSSGVPCMVGRRSSGVPCMVGRRSRRTLRAPPPAAPAAPPRRRRAHLSVRVSDSDSEEAEASCPPQPRNDTAPCPCAVPDAPPPAAARDEDAAMEMEGVHMRSQGAAETCRADVAIQEPCLGSSPSPAEGRTGGRQQLSVPVLPTPAVVIVAPAPSDLPATAMGVPAVVGTHPLSVPLVRATVACEQASAKSGSAAEDEDVPATPPLSMPIVRPTAAAGGVQAPWEAPRPCASEQSPPLPETPQLLVQAVVRAESLASSAISAVSCANGPSSSVVGEMVAETPELQCPTHAMHGGVGCSRVVKVQHVAETPPGGRQRDAVPQLSGLMPPPALSGGALSQGSTVGVLVTPLSDDALGGRTPSTEVPNTPLDDLTGQLSGIRVQHQSSLSQPALASGNTAVSTTTPPGTPYGVYAAPCTTTSRQPLAATSGGRGSPQQTQHTAASMTTPIGTPFVPFERLLSGVTPSSDTPGGGGPCPAPPVLCAETPLAPPHDGTACPVPNTPRARPGGVGGGVLAEVTPAVLLPPPPPPPPAVPVPADSEGDFTSESIALISHVSCSTDHGDFRQPRLLVSDGDSDEAHEASSDGGGGTLVSGDESADLMQQAPKRHVEAACASGASGSSSLFSFEKERRAKKRRKKMKAAEAPGRAVTQTAPPPAPCNPSAGTPPAHSEAASNEVAAFSGAILAPGGPATQRSAAAPHPDADRDVDGGDASYATPFSAPFAPLPSVAAPVTDAHAAFGARHLSEIVLSAWTRSEVLLSSGSGEAAPRRGTAINFEAARTISEGCMLGEAEGEAVHQQGERLMYRARQPPPTEDELVASEHPVQPVMCQEAATMRSVLQGAAGRSLPAHQRYVYRPARPPPSAAALVAAPPQSDPLCTPSGQRPAGMMPPPTGGRGVTPRRPGGLSLLSNVTGGGMSAASDSPAKAMLVQRARGKPPAAVACAPAGKETPSKETPQKTSGVSEGTAASQGSLPLLLVTSLEVLATVGGNKAAPNATTPDPVHDPISMLVLVTHSCRDMTSLANDRRHLLAVAVDALGNQDAFFLPMAPALQLVVEFHATEKALILEAVRLLQAADPDVLLGWDTARFSYGYLSRRAAYYGIDLPHLLGRARGTYQRAERPKASRVGRGDEVSAFETGASAVVGRVAIEMWRALRHELKLTSYTLAHVAKAALGRTVPVFDHVTLSRWARGHGGGGTGNATRGGGCPRPAPAGTASGALRGRAAEYLLNNACLAIEIAAHLDLFNRGTQMARIYGIQFADVFTRGSQFKVENMFVRLAKPLGYVMLSPSRVQVRHQNHQEGVPLVMEPRSGFYTDPVAVLDFRSLYPSIVIAYNLCYSTCIGKINATRRDKKLGTSLYKAPVLPEADRAALFIAPNSCGFMSKDTRTGVLPRVLAEILTTRFGVQAVLKQARAAGDAPMAAILHARQLGLKMLANVTYGYASATFTGRMPCSDVADAIVLTARDTVERLIRDVNAHPTWNARVVYGDTDSIFVSFPGASRARAFRIGQEIVAHAAATNPSPVKLKLEKVYDPCFLVTKKRYGGWAYEHAAAAEPVFDAKGLECIRRDQCRATQKVQENAMKTLFAACSKDRVGAGAGMERVKEYVLRQFKKIMAGEVSPAELMIQQEVRFGSYANPEQLPPAAKVAQEAMKREGLNAASAPLHKERVPYLVVNVAADRLTDKLVHPASLLGPAMRGMTAGSAGNHYYYITKQIAPALDRVLGLAGAEVGEWVASMPKPRLKGSTAAGDPDGRGAGTSAPPTAFGGANTVRQKNTLRSYYTSALCRVCKAALQPPQQGAKYCAACRRSPSYAQLLLAQRLRDARAEAAAVDAACARCVNSYDRDVYRACWSLDCDVPWRRQRADAALQKAFDAELDW